MVISFIQKLHASGFCKLLKAVQHFRGISLELLYCRAGYAVACLKLAVCLFNKLKHHIVCRNIAFFGNFLHYLLVFIAVKIIRSCAYVKYLVLSQPERLVHLEIKAYIYHFCLLFFIMIFFNFYVRFFIVELFFSFISCFRFFSYFYYSFLLMSFLYWLLISIFCYELYLTIFG